MWWVNWVSSFDIASNGLNLAKLIPMSGKITEGLKVFEYDYEDDNFEDDGAYASDED